jgi:hypothetical protein
MRKTIFVALICLFCLSACNLPLPSSTQDSAGIVATRVAQTLNAAPLSVTASLLPPIPTNSLPTETSPTITPSQTDTVTPTVTATLADPKLNLGSPAYANTFTGGKDFGLSSPYTDDSVKISVHDGVLDFSSLALNYGRRYQLTYPKPKDFYLEGVFQPVNCIGFDHYGLVTRAPNYFDGYGYYIGFSCNGQFIIQKWDSNGVATLVNWTSDAHILSGSGQTNRLGVWMKGNDIKLYANGALIKEFSDSSFPNTGHFGIYGGAVDTSNFTFQVTEISQWNLP